MSWSVARMHGETSVTQACHVHRTGINVGSFLGQRARGASFGRQALLVGADKGQAQTKPPGWVDHAHSCIHARVHTDSQGDLSRNYMVIGMAVAHLGLRPNLKQFEQAVEQFWTMTLPRGVTVCSIRAAMTR